ncbi:MAG TPA: chemotaxis response regulator protein-glutamate methylesterase [Steroidobacteraceae bacterium]|jgi:chemotaxis response regulator CheB|nr:chemotaxis response regulator protein-glutamate methylesterase [Steroidobacteraceae bacterium]
MRVAIASHSPATIAALHQALSLRPAHQIVWVAPDGAHAVAACARDTPDLLLMDLILPGLDGVEATRRITAATPCAIVIVTASVNANTSRVFDAMGHGAVDAVDTPTAMQSNPKAAAQFLQKIDTLARLVGTRRFIPTPEMFGDTWVIGRRERLVAIGASAGGPAAIARVLEGLPRGFPAAVVIVQHVDERFAPGMAEWLSRTSPLPVRVAQEGERLVAGIALLSGTNDHLVLKSADRLGYEREPKEHAYRPSVDVFFESVSAKWPGEAVGVLLTGMGRDGAKGLKTLRNKGYYTIAQDEATSAVYGMPKAAATLGAAVDVLPLERIAPRLIDTFSHV